MSASSATTVVLSSPRFVWALYVEYLWNYEANSWVASTAYTFRVLSLLLLAPITILTLLVSVYYPSLSHWGYGGAWIPLPLRVDAAFCFMRRDT